MSALSPEIVRAQAAALRGAGLDERRAQSLGADAGRIIDAVDGARALLDFNDEPARFDALVAAHALPRKGGYGGKPGFPSVRAAARPEPKASAAAGRRK